MRPGVRAAAAKLSAASVAAIASVCAPSASQACSKDGVVSTCLCAAAPKVDAAALTLGATAHAHDDSALATQAITRAAPGAGIDPRGIQLVHVFNFDYSINLSTQPIVDATISVGDTVRWLWDEGSHTVTSVSGSVESYDSGFITTPGATFDHTFTHAGVFWYYCSIHGFDNFDGTADGMAGTVTVLAVTGSSWAVNADGNWNTATNWSDGTIPNAAGTNATFGSAITAPRTVSVTAPVTVGAITFDNANAYTIAGPATISLNAGTTGGAGVTLLSGTGHAITAPLLAQTDATFNVITSNGTLTVSNLQPTTATLIKAGPGALVVNNVRTSGSLQVNAGTVSVITNGSAAGTSRVGALSVIDGTALDLNNNDLVVGAATPMASVETLVRNARGIGNWNNFGLTSTTARNNAAKTTGLGVLRGDEYTSFGGTGTFSGQPYAAGDTLVKYTWNGDANFSGTVSFDDYVRIDIGFNTQRTGWSNGDFNYSNTINFDDYVLIDIAFNQQNGTLSRVIDWISGDDRSELLSATPGVQVVVDHFGQFGLPYAQSFLAAVPEPSVALFGVQAIACKFLCQRGRRRRTSHILLQ